MNTPTPNETLVRRAALQELFRRFVIHDANTGAALEAADADAPPNPRADGSVPRKHTGQNTRFAAAIGTSVSMLSHLRSSRPISPKLARQIESNVRSQLGWADIQEGWMDKTHNEPVITDAERHLMDEALAAYRRGNAQSKRELLKYLKAFGH